MSGMYRLIKGMYRLDKSTQALHQSTEIDNSISEARQKLIVPKTASQFLKESARHFQQAFHLAVCALKCFSLSQIGNLSKLLHFQKWIQRKRVKMLSPYPKRKRMLLIVIGFLLAAFFTSEVITEIMELRAKNTQAKEQTIDYQQQIVLKHETEALADHFYRVSVIFDTNYEERADFQIHDVKWLQSVTDELLKQDLESDKIVDVYNKAVATGGLKSKDIKNMADELKNIASKLPKPIENKD